MDWTCPRCGSRTYHYDRTRIQNRCSGCGYVVGSEEQAQQQMRYDQALANARMHLRAGNWNQAVSLMQPLVQERPADVVLNRLLLQAATQDFQDCQVADQLRFAAAADAWDHLARLNGLTGQMLRYGQERREWNRARLKGMRNRFLRRVLLAACLYPGLMASIFKGQGVVCILLVVAMICIVRKANWIEASAAMRALRRMAPDGRANPFR